MDLTRAVYGRDLKSATMRALDAGSSTGEIARKYQLSPKLLGVRPSIAQVQWYRLNRLGI